LMLEKMGISQSLAAAQLGVSVQLINRIIRGGGGISRKLAVRMQAIWGIETDWLVYGEVTRLVDPAGPSLSIVRGPPWVPAVRGDAPMGAEPDVPCVFRRAGRGNEVVDVPLGTGLDRGEKIVTVDRPSWGEIRQEDIEEGEIVAVEIMTEEGPLRKVCLWWSQEGNRTWLASISRSHEPPLELSVKKIRRVWRLLGATF